MVFLHSKIFSKQKGVTFESDILHSRNYQRKFLFICDTTWIRIFWKLFLHKGYKIFMDCIFLEYWTESMVSAGYVFFLKILLNWGPFCGATGHWHPLFFAWDHSAAHEFKAKTDSSSLVLFESNWFWDFSWIFSIGYCEVISNCDTSFWNGESYFRAEFMVLDFDFHQIFSGFKFPNSMSYQISCDT